MTDDWELVKWIIRADRHSLAALVEFSTETQVFAQPWIIRKSIQKLHLLNGAPVAQKASTDMAHATQAALATVAHRRRKQLIACMSVQISTRERTERALLIVWKTGTLPI